MVTHNVPEFVYITEDEFTALRTLAVERRHMDVQFNGTTMRLANSAVNHWVFPVLADWRGLND